jgi:hypothetical protein
LQKTEHHERRKGHEKAQFLYQNSFETAKAFIKIWQLRAEMKTT